MTSPDEAPDASPAAHPTPPARAGGSRRNSARVSSGILLSRVTGLGRERAIGHFLGTSIAVDAFTAAFRIPNLLQHLLGEGVLSASFIPVYSRLLAEGRDEEAGRVAGAVLGLLAVAAGGIALVGALFAEPLTWLTAAGFRGRPETFDLTVTLVRLLFPAIGLLVLSAWCLGVLNSHRRFFLSYVAPAVLNLTQVAVLVALGLTVYADQVGTPEGQADLVTWMAVGTVVGGALQFLVQVPAVRRVGVELRPSLRTDLAGVRETLRAFGPVVGARGVVQVSHWLQVLLASFLAAGALATLRYGQLLHGLPIALFGMAVAAAELPEVARRHATEAGALPRRVRAGLGRIATFVVPTTLGYLLVGDLIIGAVLQTGRFDRLDTLAVWVVLGGYAIGLLASTSSRLLQSALYGIGDPQTPARVAIVRVLVAAALGALLMLQLDRVAVTAEGLRVVGDLPAFRPLPGDVRAARPDDLIRLGAAGLSLAAGLAAWLEYGLLRRAVARRIGPAPVAGEHGGALLAGAIPAGAAALALRPLLTALPPLLAGPLVVLVVAGIHLPVAARAGAPEARDLLAAVGRRLRRRRQRDEGPGRR